MNDMDCIICGGARMVYDPTKRDTLMKCPGQIHDMLRKQKGKP